MAALSLAALCLHGCSYPPLASPLVLHPGPQENVSAPLVSAAEAVDAACSWLVQHQQKEGHWSAGGELDVKDATEGSAPNDDEFWSSALGLAKVQLDVWAPADGSSDPQYDVGVTALALHALLADGSTLVSGGYSDELKRGLDWLTEHQDPGTGLIGKAEGYAFHYGRAVATLVLGEALNAMGRDAQPDDAALRFRPPFRASSRTAS